MIKKLKNKTLRKIFILVNIIYTMPKRFNFKKMIGRPFMKDIVHPLVGVARPFVNQGLAALKDKGLAMAKDYGTKFYKLLQKHHYRCLKIEVEFLVKKVDQN